MFRGFSGRQRVAPLAERRTATRLREALAALPAPWVVLANRRASGADGPPWVRFIALHPDKGVALVDTDSPDAAVAPLEDFLARTGFAALQAGALPIVPVAVGAGEVGVVADLLDAAFASMRGMLGNPNWCEAVMELLVTAPDLMLAHLRRTPVAARPSAPEPPPRQPARRAAPQPSRRALTPEPTRADPSLSSQQSQPRTAPPVEPQRARPPGPSHVDPSFASLPSLAAAPQQEPPRLVPRRVRPAAPPTESPQPEAMRLVPRQVAAKPESPPLRRHAHPLEPHSETPPAADELAISRGTGRRTPGEPVDPQFDRRDAGSRFALEADEPIIPLRQTRASRGRREPSLHIGALRPDSGLLDWRAPRRRWPYAAAAAVLLAAVGAIALWYSEAPPPAEQATVPSAAAPPTTASLTPPTVPPPAPVTAAPTAPPPLHATATPQAPAAAPSATPDELPRAVLQPSIASTPPLPLPLPAAKLAPQAPVRTAAVPKPAYTKPPSSTKSPSSRPVTAATPPQAPAPKTAKADSDLPPSIEAVLHPGAQPPQPPSQAAATAVTPATPPAVGSSTPPPGGTVSVGGVTYVNGEQPHSLGNVGSQPSTAPPSAPPAIPAPALASNGPVNTPAPSPREVVISRAPSVTPAPAAGLTAATVITGVANGPPREVVISRAPSPAPDAPPPGGAQAVPSNATPRDATGSPQSIQAAPLSGSSP